MLPSRSIFRSLEKRSSARRFCEPAYLVSLVSVFSICWTFSFLAVCTLIGWGSPCGLHVIGQLRDCLFTWAFLVRRFESGLRLAVRPLQFGNPIGGVGTVLRSFIRTDQRISVWSGRIKLYRLNPVIIFFAEWGRTYGCGGARNPLLLRETSSTWWRITIVRGEVPACRVAPPPPPDGPRRRNPVAQAMASLAASLPGVFSVTYSSPASCSSSKSVVGSLSSLNALTT